MKKIFTLFATVAFGATSFAQLGEQLNVNSDIEASQFLTNETELIGLDSDINASRGTATCVDTNRWAWGRSFNNGASTFFTNQLLNDTNGTISGWSVYFEVPSGASVDVSGIRTYARSIRGDGASVNLTCAVYNATSDSLPSGTPVELATIALDTFTGNTIAGFEQDVIFNSTATMNGSFVVVLEVTGSAGDSIEVLRGFTGSGLNDYPFAYKVPSIDPAAWFHGSLFGPNFARVPHVYPFVSFDITNSITADTNAICEANEIINFASNNAWYNNQYWTVDGFVGQNASYWSVNGSAFGGPDADTNITFADPTVNYDITLHDSLFTWFNGVCATPETITVTGEASNTDASVGDLAAGTTSTDACNNAPGTTTIYTLGTTDVFYTDTVIACTPALVPAGFMSNGVTWWEFDATGTLINTNSCGTSSINEVSSINSKAFFANDFLNVYVGSDLIGASSVMVYDVTGRSVMTLNLNAEEGSMQQFDASALPSGIYLISAAEFSAKIVK